MSAAATTAPIAPPRPKAAYSSEPPRSGPAPLLPDALSCMATAATTDPDPRFQHARLVVACASVFSLLRRATDPLDDFLCREVDLLIGDSPVRCPPGSTVGHAAGL